MRFIRGVFKIREHFSGPTRDLNLNIWGGVLDIGIKKKKISPDDSKGQNPGMSETESKREGDFRHQRVMYRV